MTELSDFRNFVLRKTYEQAQHRPDATVAITELVAAFGKPLQPGWITLVIDDLKSSGLVRPAGDEGAIALTAQGAYEAERLGGAYKTPAIARLWRSARNYERIGAIAGVLGLLVTIIAFAVPAYYDWQDRRAAAEAKAQSDKAMEDAAGMAKIVSEGQQGVEGSSRMMEADDYCRDYPTAEEYAGLSCAISRREREATDEEARTFCKQYPTMFTFGGKNCDKFR